jgi:hypothetical protein
MSRLYPSLLRALLLCLLLPIVGFAGALAATGGNDSPLAVEPALMVASMFLSSLAGRGNAVASDHDELKANANAGEPASRCCIRGCTACRTCWAAGAPARFGFLVAMQQQAGAWWLLGIRAGCLRSAPRRCSSGSPRRWSLKVKP